MGRIRLQICVLPWEQPCVSSSASAQTRQETLKWCEPCLEDTSMQELCDRIYKSWKKIFGASMGPLTIRHLKTAYGEILDLEDRVVGEFFDDRGADGNIRNSILEVHRYPPPTAELQTVPRFFSLAPESSARPHKRPLELLSPSHPSQTSRNTDRTLPSIEDWGSKTDVPFGTRIKRQRTHESGLNRISDAHQKLVMREEQGGGPYHFSQSSGTQGSIHQVVDSQKSPGKKNLNPYGTPTSLPLNSLQEPIASNGTDLSLIPDSPLSRRTTVVDGTFGGAMQLDPESTNPESPELRASVDESPPANLIRASDEQHIESPSSPESSEAHSINNLASQPVPISQNPDENLMNHDLGLRKSQEKLSDINPKRRSSTATPAHAQNVHSHGKALRKSDQIFDYIESDTESFNEKQQMQSAKRLRSSKTPIASFKSLGTSDKAGLDCRDGKFLVPSVPHSCTNGARKSICEVATQGKQENIQVSARASRDANITAQSGPMRRSEYNAVSSKDAQSKSAHKDLQIRGPETSRGNMTCDDPVDSAQNSSQATTAWSQISNKFGNGTTESDVQQKDNRVPSKFQNRDETTQLIGDVGGEIKNPETIRSVQKAKRLAAKTEEQLEKKRVREEKTEEKRVAHEAMEKEIAAEREAAERKRKEKILADKKSAKEHKARAEESARAKEASAKEVELAEAKRMKEVRVNEARSLEEKKINERLARQRQNRERTLAEEANKLKVAAEGAKQIEAERKEKEQARRKELAAKRNANEAKADEQAKEMEGKDRDKKARGEQRAQENAQKIADIESRDAKNKVQEHGTIQAASTAVREQAQKRLADREMQKLRDSSGARNRNSSNPSTTSNTADPRRSMTPRVPGSSTIKSSPSLNSLRSSPLSNRSSGNMDAPLRSALRQTPSTLRRSVSSVSFDVPARAKPDEYISSMLKPRSIKEINRHLAATPSSVLDLSENQIRIESKTPSKTPIKTLPKNAPDGKITKTSTKNGKVQTKLNVTREPKKLKGRAIKPPMQASKQEIIISSGDESSTSQEPMWQTGNAEAGPSSRKPIFPAGISQGKEVAEVKSSGASIDPTIRKIKLEKNNKVAPATFARSTSKLNTTALQKSTSRSPAMALSETKSLSSGSNSRSTSNSDSASGSEKDEHQAPTSKAHTGAKNGKLVPVTTKGISKAVNVVIKQPEGDNLNRKLSSQASSQASSSRPHSTISMHGDGKHVARAADEQLQLESQQSIPKSSAKQASSTTNNSVDGKVINQGLDHAGRLPNGIRPAYYKYPALSELQKLPREVTPKAEPKVGTSSSQQLSASPEEKAGSDESSSDSDDSSSDSNEDDDVDKTPSQTSLKRKSSLEKGMRGLLKIANSLRSNVGPA